MTKRLISYVSLGDLVAPVDDSTPQPPRPTRRSTLRPVLLTPVTVPVSDDDEDERGAVRVRFTPVEETGGEDDE